WVLLGLSQVAVLRALGLEGVGPERWPAVVAAVALATVAGFAVPVAPGGLGVREWVLWTSLETAVDRQMAVVAALALRLTWVARGPRPGRRRPAGARHPLPPQLRQGRGADRRLPGRPRRRRLHPRRRPPGRPGRGPPLPRGARPGPRRRQRLEADPPRPLAQG